MPTICSPLKGQRHEEVKKHFPFLNDLNLNDPESDEVGADFYRTIVSGNITRCGANGLVAMNSKLEWPFKLQSCRKFYGEFNICNES